MSGRELPPEELADFARQALWAVDQVSGDLDQVSPGLGWTSRDWEIGTTGLRMHLSSVRSQLRTFGKAIRADAVPTLAIEWAMEVTSACSKIRRSLEELAVDLGTLIHEKTSHRELIAAAARWDDNADDLLDDLAAFKQLLTQVPGPRPIRGGRR